MMASSFFFKQKTAYELRISDWSSDVCSSDLDAERLGQAVRPLRRADQVGGGIVDQPVALQPAEETPHGTEAARQRGGGKAVIAQIGRASGRERVCQYV